MTRKISGSRRHARKPRPVPPSIRDPGLTTALDSEDAAGTYAPRRSKDDTGESDEGVFAQGPLPAAPASRPRAKRRKEATR